MAEVLAGGKEDLELFSEEERLKIYAESGASGASFHPLPCTSRQPPEDVC